MRWTVIVSFFSQVVEPGDFFGHNLQKKVHQADMGNNGRGNVEKGGRMNLGVSQRTMKQTLGDYGDSLLLRELQLDDPDKWKDKTLADIREDATLEVRELKRY